MIINLDINKIASKYIERDIRLARKHSNLSWSQISILTAVCKKRFFNRLNIMFVATVLTIFPMLILIRNIKTSGSLSFTVDDAFAGALVRALIAVTLFHIFTITTVFFFERRQVAKTIEISKQAILFYEIISPEQIFFHKDRLPSGGDLCTLEKFRDLKISGAEITSLTFKALFYRKQTDTLLAHIIINNIHHGIKDEVSTKIICSPKIKNIIEETSGIKFGEKKEKIFMMKDISIEIADTKDWEVKWSMFLGPVLGISDEINFPEKLKGTAFEGVKFVE